MDKVLIFGCSYSSGSWYYDPTQANGTNENYYPGSEGWYDYVRYFYDKDVTVVSQGGSSYWAWFQLLLMLKETDRLKEYNEIWIQESEEPRFFFINSKEWQLNWNIWQEETITGKRRIVNMSKNALDTNIDDSFDTSELYIQHNNARMFYNNLVSADGFYDIMTSYIYKHFQEICKQFNIKGYVWSWNEKYMKCTHFKRVLDDVENVKQLLIKQGNCFTVNKKEGHQTREGNKFVGELINNEMG